MTEEEKRAIEQLKKLNKIIFYPRYKSYFINNMGEIDNAIHTILNFVEKLQKENEELNNRDTSRLSEIGDLRSRNNYLENEIEYYYIPKYKIREKIKELEQDMVLHETRQVLKELLEEE